MVDVNGSQQVTLVRNVISDGGKMLLVYSTNQGMFLGQLKVRAMNGEALAAIANDFQAFIADQTGKLQVASGLPAGAIKLS